MTAIAIAMLGIVLLATAVLGVVGAVHELSRSARGRRWARRRRYAIQMHAETVREAAAHGLRVSRRTLAEQLAQPAPVHLPQPALRVGHPVSR